MTWTRFLTIIGDGLFGAKAGPTHLSSAIYPATSWTSVFERAIENAALWAIFPPGLKKHMTSDLYREFVRTGERTIAIGEPMRMNQRLVAQAGTFVMPGVLDEPVETLVPEKAIIKIVLETSKIRRQAMEELYNMNITHATLFPGLDGLARSLSYELEYNWEFDPVTLKRKMDY